MELKRFAIWDASNLIQPKEMLKANNFSLFVTSENTGRQLSKHCLPMRLVQETFIQCLRGWGQGA